MVRSVAAVERVVRRTALKEVISGTAIQRRPHGRRRDEAVVGNRDVEDIVAVERNRAAGVAALSGAARPGPHGDVVGARRGEGVGDERVDNPARSVVVPGQLVAGRIEQPQGGVEAGPVDVKGTGRPRRHGEGEILLATARAGATDDRVRGRGRVHHAGIVHLVEIGIDVHRRSYRQIGRARPLDHIGRGHQDPVSCDEVVAAAFTVDRVNATPAVDRFTGRRAGQGVVEGAALQDFEPAEGIGSGGSRGCAGRHIDGDAAGGPAVAEHVVAVAAGQVVIAATAGDGVVAITAVDRIVAIRTVDQVAIGGPGQGLVGGVALHHLAGGFGVCDRHGLIGEFQRLDAAQHIRAVRAGDGRNAILLTVDRLGAVGDRVGRPVAREDGRVGAAAAPDIVVAGPARQAVVGAVAEDRIGTEAADRMLNDRAHGDRDIADQPSDA